MELSNMEKLPFLKIIHKELTALIKDIEGEEKMELQESGYSKKNMAIDGQKFGDLTYYEPKPKVEIRPEKKTDALLFLQDEGLAELNPCKGWDERFAIVGQSIVDKNTGENCDDLFYIGQTPGRCVSKLDRGVTVDAVVQALQPKIGQVDVRYFLEN